MHFICAFVLKLYGDLKTLLVSKFYLFRDVRLLKLYSCWATIYEKKDSTYIFSYYLLYLFSLLYTAHTNIYIYNILYVNKYNSLYFNTGLLYLIYSLYIFLFFVSFFSLVLKYFSFYLFLHLKIFVLGIKVKIFLFNFQQIKHFLSSPFTLN